MTLDSVTPIGTGLVAAASGVVVLSDAFEVLDRAVSLVPPPTHVVIDFSAADRVDFSLEDVHELARHIRDSRELRGQRHAFVAPSASARSHVSEYEFMITEMMDWWGDDPVEVAVFDSIPSALEWGSARIRPAGA